MAEKHVLLTHVTGREPCQKYQRGLKSAPNMEDKKYGVFFSRIKQK